MTTVVGEQPLGDDLATRVEPAPPRARRRRRPNTPFVAGLAILAALAILALLGPVLYGTNPLAIHYDEVLLPPSSAHLFGTDSYGRDVLARIISGARIDLLIPVLVIAVAAPIGTVLGATAGFLGGAFDQILMRLVDIMLAFPGFLLALVIVAVVGNGVGVVVFALAVANIPYFARLTRSRVLAERSLEYVEAATVVGNPRWRTGFVHIMPNTLGPTYAQASLAFGWVILDTAGLAFLGVGITPPTAEWGVMISDGSHDILTGVWWTSVFPGLFILIAVLGANLIGVGLRKRYR